MGPVRNRDLATGSQVKSLLRTDPKIYCEPVPDSFKRFLTAINKRHEQKPIIIITTNLPFSEWTSVFPHKRLCRSVVDRVTHRAHIKETGNRSARLAETLTKMSKKVTSKAKETDDVFV